MEANINKSVVGTCQNAIIVLYCILLYCDMTESIDDGLGGLRAEVEPYVQRFAHVCADAKQKEEMEQLVFTLYVSVDHPQQFLAFVDSFHVACTSLGDFRRLCSAAVDFTNVWRDTTIARLMTTMVRGRILLRDESGAMRAHGAGIARLELLVSYLCEDRFIDWFNRGLDEGSDAVAAMRFFEGSSGFVDLLDWVHNSVTVNPHVLHLFVELWKANGVDDCKKFARLYKRYVDDPVGYGSLNYAMNIMKDGYALVAERFLIYLTKKRNVRVEDLYRGVCDFLEANNERGALELLNLEASGQ